ncbi:unnamed protein product [Strongylus vulgaris]|uniref:Spindle assembly abnormal protein 6 N-terminal domain-containing protein n=1 Tax=Strongylus vulgaris TaxID=40348 RepID=A0A3P7IIC0_STRVU|nr:unnamed protein product [Strongylus vulgaris]
MTTTSEGQSQLFRSLPVTLLQPNRNGPDRPDEFEFLYAESITRAKYQALAKTWNLNVDFDDFPVKIVRLLHERKNANSSVQLTCTLSQDLSLCTSLKMEKERTVQECEELKQTSGELQERCCKTELEKSELEQRVKDAEKRLAEETLKREEFEQDLEVSLLSLVSIT